MSLDEVAPLLPSMTTLQDSKLKHCLFISVKAFLLIVVSFGIIQLSSITTFFVEASTKSVQGKLKICDYPPTAKLSGVWVSKRRLTGLCLYGSPSHWAVIIQVEHFGFINAQFGAQIETSCHPTMNEAARATSGGRACDIRTSTYGRAYDYITFGLLTEELFSMHQGRYSDYVLFFNDSQTFARSLVKWLNGKWVGVFPLEDGPVFSNHF